MGELTFTLEGVVKEKNDYTDFTGPLTLILQLLTRNKISIKDVSLSQILEQYLAWLKEMAEMDLDIASDFVAMASHLAYIKSKTLLGEGEPEELTELISSLERLRATDVYAQIKGIVGELGEMYYNGAGFITKTPSPITPDEHYRYEHNVSDLTRAFEMILLRTVSPDEIIKTVKGSAPRPIAFPIDEKIAQITRLLSKSGSIDLRNVIKNCDTRSEMVATFVAVLELCAAGRVAFDEDLAYLLCLRADSSELEDINAERDSFNADV